MTAVYQRDPLHFLYPENWSVVEESWDQWPREVSVQSPGGAFWSVHVYPATDPRPLTQEVLNAMKQEYEQLESSVLAEDYGDRQVTGFEMHFYCLDFLVRARTLGIRRGDVTYLLVFQAEDRDFDQLEPVFRAMTLSLVQAGEGDRQ
jgi:hypothetical protein